MIAWRLLQRPPEEDLARWLTSQAHREATSIRLEDALLGDRFAAYFGFRLRFFAVRTALAVVIHSVKVLLLFQAFPRVQFVTIIVLGAGAAIVNDFWWGALERMRQRIRAFQRDGAGHRVPNEIGSWLSFASILSRAGLALVATWVGYRLFLGSGLTPADSYAAALVAGAAGGLIVRTYHSGAYALRRIFRPLPSLLLADSLALLLLLALWPLLGVWAFPVSETLAIAGALTITVYYTTRTYAVAGFPSLRSLMRTHHPLPPAVVLLSAFAPGISYGLVGIESLVLFAVMVGASAAGKASLLALLAALGPIIRAGFEWAQLLYFDLVRMEVPLLRGLRQRFDLAVLRLAMIMGIATWAVASIVGVSVLGVRDFTLLLALLPFFVTRSLLASAQVRTFTAGAYGRLSLVGTLGALGSLTVLVIMRTEADCVAILSVVLGISFMALLALPAATDFDDRVLALPDWLSRLRGFSGPVTVTRIMFDTKTEARGVTVEERRTDEWRRRMVARDIGSRVARTGGAAAWLGPYELAWFGSLDEGNWITRTAGGLLMRQPAISPFSSGAAAAQDVLSSRLGVCDAAAVPDAEAIVAEFERSFPEGLVYHADRPVPFGMAVLSSRERCDVLRAALRFVRDPVPAKQPHRWDITALADGGRLRVIFVIDRRHHTTARRQWAKRVRAWDLATAALGDRADRPLTTAPLRVPEL